MRALSLGPATPRWALVAALVFMITGFGLDDWTTYVALSSFADRVYEMNPLTRFEIRLAGLSWALALNFLMGIGMGLYIASTQRIKEDGSRVIILGGLGLVRWYAGIHNLTVIYILGGI